MSYMWKTCGIYSLTTPRLLHESRRNTTKLLQEAHLHILHLLHLQPQPLLLVRPWNCRHQYRWLFQGKSGCWWWRVEWMNTGIIYNSPPLLKAWNHMTIVKISGFIVQFLELSCELLVACLRCPIPYFAIIKRSTIPLRCYQYKYDIPPQDW